MAGSRRGMPPSLTGSPTTQKSHRASSNKLSMHFTLANLNWNTPAGRELDRLIAALPAQPPREITVFGSAPLQLLISPDFLSADVDVIGGDDLAELVAARSLGPQQSELAIHVCDPLTFQTTADWTSRALRVNRHGQVIILPHPWDILVSKLPRLEPKDIEAYRLVIRLTGHPTEPELLDHLGRAVDLFRPAFDEERGGNTTNNARVLWRELFNHALDVRAQIIAPALERRRQGYGRQATDPGSALRGIETGS